MCYVQNNPGKPALAKVLSKQCYNIDIRVRQKKITPFCYNKDNYLKFSAFMYFLLKKTPAKFQPYITNLEASIKFLVGGPFF